MIADWGGASLEYNIMGKPVIYIDTPPKIRNLNYEALNILPIEIKIREEIGSIFNLKNIKDISYEIFKLIQKKNETTKDINNYIFDYQANIDYVTKFISNLVVNND